MRIDNSTMDLYHQKTDNTQLRNMKCDTNVNGQKVQPSNEVVPNEQVEQEYEHEVIQAIEKANKHIKTYDRKLEFAIHDATKQIIVRVIDTENDTVIREIPSEKVLDLVAHMCEVAGILIDEKR